MKDRYYLDQRIAAAYDAECSRSAVTRDDIPFYVQLAREAATAGQPVLELACGTGRVTLPIAAAGVSISGLDLSPAMLDIARGRSPDADNPHWLEGDMADFRLGQSFGLVIIPFRSFQHLLRVSGQLDCLRLAYEHLLPNGRLALNIVNPEAILPAVGVNRRSPAGGSSEAPTDEGAVISRATGKLRLRYVFHYEMEQLLSMSGFAVEALYGWFDRRPFDDDSSEMVWLARKI